MRRIFILFTIVLLGTLAFNISAQSNQLAATLEVLDAGVEVQRVNTSNWIEIGFEAIVGVGDSIRTGDTGRARITFFSDGVETDILPNSEIVIEDFSGVDESFVISVSVLIGRTEQRLNRVLDANSSYDIQTPSMILGARGTEFAVRVDEGGQRTAMLVREGAVEAESETNATTAEVPLGFGIRAVADETLSDVVAATTFDELDAALDGCSTAITLPDDVSINVRIAPQVDAPRVGTISPADVVLLMGRTDTTQWYRINYRDGFGWILSSIATVSDCAGLRVFPDNQGSEDTTLYSSIGEEVDLTMPEPTPETDEDESP